jgi:hypothetical protein
LLDIAKLPTDLLADGVPAEKGLRGIQVFEGRETLIV